MKRLLVLVVAAGLFGVGLMAAADKNLLVADKNPIVVMDTSKGTIRIELFADKAPETVENVLSYVDKKFYDGTIFHRVIPNFMIQGGDPAGNGTGGPGYQFEDEFDSSLSFDKTGLLAMANAGPGTNGSQFFVTVSKPDWLNHKHTIFGEIVEGQDVVGKIVNVPRNRQDKPNKDVVVTSVVIERT